MSTKYVAVTRDVSDFQQPLTEQQVVGLCQRAFGCGSSLIAWKLLTTGKYNTCYRIELSGRSPVVLRVAPPPKALVFRHEQYLLRRESSVQQVIYTASNTIPRNLFTDFSQELIDRDYVFQNCLPGELWEDIKPELSDEDNEQLWVQLAPIVKKIHAIPGQRFGPPSPMRGYKSWSDAVISWIKMMLDDMRCCELPCDDARQFLRLVSKGCEHLDKVKQPRLVHGDLWQKNILVSRRNGQFEISGVLDAERAFYGEPLAEWIFTFLDIPDSFWQVYGKLENDESAAFRRLVYEGRGTIQLCLEAWRFHFDDTFARDILNGVTRNLSEFFPA